VDPAARDRRDMPTCLGAPRLRGGPRPRARMITAESSLAWHRSSGVYRFALSPACAGARSRSPARFRVPGALYASCGAVRETTQIETTQRATVARVSVSISTR
jgi:hypothetical protein